MKIIGFLMIGGALIWLFTAFPVLLMLLLILALLGWGFILIFASSTKEKQKQIEEWANRNQD